MMEMETLQEQEAFEDETKRVLEEYGKQNFKSSEEQAEYLLSHGGCYFEDFEKQMRQEITDYYKSKENPTES
jgi:hypothetical protein